MGWYFECVEEGISMLIWIVEGVLLFMVEMVLVFGGWMFIDWMWREHFLGFDDFFIEVGVDCVW